MATNEILPFAQGGGANVQSQIDYAAEPLRSSGNVAGIARGAVNNKALRQASVISAGTAQFLADNQATNITDSLTPTQIAAAFGQAIGTVSGVTSVTMTSTNVTLTDAQAIKSIIIISGTLTANVQLIFPTYAKQWQVINNTTGAFSITCGTAAGSGVTAIQGQSVNIVGDGEKIIYGSQNIEDSGWLTISLQNGYTMDAANPIRYRKIGKFVYITGAVRRSAAISGLQTIFTLPVGYRPSKPSQVGSPIWVYDNLATQIFGAGIGTDGGLNTGYVINLAGTPSGAGGCSINGSFIVD